MRSRAAGVSTRPTVRASTGGYRSVIRLSFECGAQVRAQDLRGTVQQRLNAGDGGAQPLHLGLGCYFAGLVVRANPIHVASTHRRQPSLRRMGAHSRPSGAASMNGCGERGVLITRRVASALVTPAAATRSMTA